MKPVAGGFQMSNFKFSRPPVTPILTRGDIRFLLDLAQKSIRQGDDRQEYDRLKKLFEGK